MLSDSDYRAVEDFLYREARLADEARYADWLALWTDDGVYEVKVVANGQKCGGTVDVEDRLEDADGEQSCRDAPHSGIRFSKHSGPAARTGATGGRPQCPGLEFAAGD